MCNLIRKFLREEGCPGPALPTDEVLLTQLRQTATVRRANHGNK